MDNFKHKIATSSNTLKTLKLQKCLQNSGEEIISVQIEAEQKCNGLNMIYDCTVGDDGNKGSITMITAFPSNPE